MPTFKTSDGPDQATLDAVVTAAIENSDDVRRVALDFMERLAQAKAQSLARERKRVAALRGDENPEIAAIDTTIAAQTEELALTRADAQRARAASDVPATSKDTSLVRGRVVGADHAGVAGLVVAAVDNAGKSQGRATTDANGYFRLTLPAASPAPAVEGRIAIGPAATTPALRLIVSKAEREVARSDDLLSLTAGTASYLEIQI